MKSCNVRFAFHFDRKMMRNSRRTLICIRSISIRRRKIIIEFQRIIVVHRN